MAVDGRWYPPEATPAGGRALTREQAMALYVRGDRADDVMAALRPSGRDLGHDGAPPRCHRCGLELREGDRFCAGCGTRASGAAPQFPPSVPAWPAGGVGPVDRRSGAPLASIGSRLAALLIDDCLLLVVPYVAVLAVAMAVPGAASLLVVLWLAWLAVVLLYAIPGEGGPLGQTPGKALMGIKVVGPTPGPLGYGRATLRWVGRIVDVILCGLPLGVLWGLLDDERRTWHDMLADTRVVVAPPTYERSLGFWWKHTWSSRRRT